MSLRRNCVLEVEQRSFISEEKYHELIAYFKEQGVNFTETKQVTYYYLGEIDFRLMKMVDKTKLWLKGGQIHDDVRKELEVFVENEYRDTLEEMLAILGYQVEIKWFRKRLEGEYQGLALTLDYTVGYGYIIEIEKLVANENLVTDAKKELIDFFQKLKIPITDKADFQKKYEDYRINWRNYTNVDETAFLNE